VKLAMQSLSSIWATSATAPVFKWSVWQYGHRLIKWKCTVWEWYENLELYRLLFFLSKFNLDSNYWTTYMILSFVFWICHKGQTCSVVMSSSWLFLVSIKTLTMSWILFENNEWKHQIPTCIFIVFGYIVMYLCDECTNIFLTFW
jgi:hypothetical protein